MSHIEASNYLKFCLLRLRTWQFWRLMIVCFCAFSVIGHLMEWVYCYLGAVFFNTVDMDAEVLTNPFKPFFVYGFAIVFLVTALEPIKWIMLNKFNEKWQALLAFYIMSIFVGMAGELTQGFLQNQPVDGVYPLWDVSDYPGNILGQAWIVNDIFFGLVITVAVWLVYPLIAKQSGKLPEHLANINCSVIVAITFVLTVVTYGFA